MTALIMVNHKGGVGKTTTSINLAGFLAGRGYKVLAMDLDPQSNLTVGLGVDITKNYHTIGHVMTGQVPAEEAVQDIGPGLHLLPASEYLEDIIEPLKNHGRKNEILKFKLREMRSGFDFLVIDTAPSRDSLFTINGLTVADFVLIPTQAEQFSVVGLAQIMETVRRIRDDYLNPALSVLGVFVTFYRNTRLAENHMEMLKEAFVPKGQLLETRIRLNVALAEAAVKGAPINRRDAAGYLDYQSLTEEILGLLAERGLPCAGQTMERG